MENIKKKIIILYSGGLDSTILKIWADNHYPDYEIKCIYYDYGNPVCQSEILHLPEYVEVRKVDWFNNSIDQLKIKKSEKQKGAIYIPGRNLVFATLAATQELPDLIFMGGLFDEAHLYATDKSKIFIDKFNDIIKYVLSPFKDSVVLKFPFVDEKMIKIDVIKYGISNGLSENDFNKMFSCYNFSLNGKQCGHCHQCFRLFLYLYNYNFNVNFLEKPFFNSDFAWIYLNQSLEKIENGNYNDIISIYDIDYNSALQFMINNYNLFKEKINDYNFINRLQLVVNKMNRKLLEEVLK